MRRPGFADAQQEVGEELAGLDDMVDAIGDVLMAEGVYQTARGNPERAAAALDAAAHPSGPPPELEVVQSPGSGIAVTHRLTVMMPGGTPPGEPLWPPDPSSRHVRRPSRALARGPTPCSGTPSAYAC